MLKLSSFRVLLFKIAYNNKWCKNEKKKIFKKNYLQKITKVGV